MSLPTPERLLQAWEYGHGLSPTRRALALLEAAAPGDGATLAALPVGERDRRLLRLRAALFGDGAAAVTRCPRCAERLDIELPVAALCAEPPPVPRLSLTLDAGGIEIAYRLPTSEDVLLASDADGDGGRVLLERCVLDVRHGAAQLAPGDLPAAALAALETAVGEADPLVDARLALTCPACEYGWDAPLDLVAFVWDEIDAWARRMLDDVHTLARAYGWSEAAILALGPRRRQAYLDMVRS